MTRTYWLSCSKLTVCVDVNPRGLVMAGPRIVRKFLGQPLNNLKRWMEKLGSLRSLELS